MLLELVNEGWPLAIEALREQACEAKKLKLRCERLGYSESKRLVYLEWARKDPLHVWMYSKAASSGHSIKNAKKELSAEEYEYLLYGDGIKGIGNYKTIKVLNEGVKKGCTSCSIQFYNRYFFKVLYDVEKGIEVSEEYINKLKELAGITKILLLSGQDYSSTIVRQLFSYENENDNFNVKINKINKMFDIPTYTEDDIFELINIHAEKGAANFFLNINFMRNETFENQLLKSLSKDKIKAHGKRGINRVEEPNPAYKEFKRINQGRGWIRRLSHIHIDWKMHEKWKKDQQEAGLDSNIFGSLESN
ncbi:hypothetical protein VIBNISFn118_2210002 [Vibrio nigripulchritudo SFn118]|nr:hypothetical protein VIBNISFn118_2210002 [Vibrio nigripulchritudo SFn118]